MGKQITLPKKTSFKNFFYQNCGEAVLVNSELILQSQLAEGSRHKLLGTKTGTDDGIVISYEMKRRLKAALCS